MAETNFGRYKVHDPITKVVTRLCENMDRKAVQQVESDGVYFFSVASFTIRSSGLAEILSFALVPVEEFLQVGFCGRCLPHHGHW
jgi:hypothetical protein